MLCFGFDAKIMLTVYCFSECLYSVEDFSFSQQVDWVYARG